MALPGWDQARGSTWRRTGSRSGADRPAGSANRRRGLLPVAAAVGLLALVAVGSLRGPLGSGRGRPSYPADLVDSLVLLLFLAMIAAGVLAVIALWPNRHLPVRARRAGSWNLILPMAAVLLLWLFRDLLGLDGGDRDEAGHHPGHAPPSSRWTRRPSRGWCRWSWPLWPCWPWSRSWSPSSGPTGGAGARPRPGPSGWSGCSTTPSRTWSATPTRAGR